MKPSLFGVVASMGALLLMVGIMIATGAMSAGKFPAAWVIGYGVVVLGIWIGVCAKAKFDWRLLIVIVGLFVGGTTFLLHQWRDTVRNREVAAIGLDKELGSFLNAPGKGTKMRFPAVRKVVVVDVGAGKVDPLFFEMPAKLKPARADEVDTIVQLRWQQNHVGDYSNGAKAMRWSCQCVAIERKTNTAFDERSFTGSEPSRSTKRRGSVSGSKPEAQVMQFITGLVR